MANDVANHLEKDYLLSLAIEHKPFLAQIRHWGNLKVGVEDGHIWIKDFTVAQWHSAEAKSIPFASRFLVNDSLLFPEGSRLPIRKVPALLWSPIDKSIVVKKPDLNNNYFGINENIPVGIRQSNIEKAISASIINLNVLLRYLEQAPNVRTNKLQWCILGNSNAFIIGHPVLPVKGDDYWQSNSFFIPAGFSFKWQILESSIEQKLNADFRYWIVWNKDDSFIKISKEALKPLTLSSIRLSVEKMK